MLKKYFTLLFFGFSFLLGSLSAQSSWEEIDSKIRMPPQGPPGPPGPEGPLSRFACSYASAQGSQQIIKANGFFPIRFNQPIVSPFDIEHPLEGNDTQFRVKRDGVYMIGWTVVASSEVRDELKFNLLNITAQEDFKPFPQMSLDLQPNETKTLSGQTAVYLNAGQAFQFEIFTRKGNLTVIPSIVIMGVTL